MEGGGGGCRKRENIISRLPFQVFLFNMIHETSVVFSSF